MVAFESAVEAALGSDEHQSVLESEVGVSKYLNFTGTAALQRPILMLVL